jgi:hypothetical protein
MPSALRRARPASATESSGFRGTSSFALAFFFVGKICRTGCIALLCALARWAGPRPISVRGPMQTDQDGPFASAGCVGPLEMPLFPFNWSSPILNVAGQASALGSRRVSPGLQARGTDLGTRAVWNWQLPIQPQPGELTWGRWAARRTSFLEAAMARWRKQGREDSQDARTAGASLGRRR